MAPATFLRARILDGVAGPHLVVLFRKLVGVDLAALDLSRRDIFAQSQPGDRSLVELEQPIDVLAAIEVCPPLAASLRAGDMPRWLRKQYASTPVLAHEPVLFLGFRHQYVGEQRSLELGALALPRSSASARDPSVLRDAARKGKSCQTFDRFGAAREQPVAQADASSGSRRDCTLRCRRGCVGSPVSSQRSN